MGLAYGRCNMQARVNKNELAIVVHNLKGYDSKLIIEGLNNHDLIEDVEVIATNSEKFNCLFLKSKSGFGKNNLSKNFVNGNFLP